MIGSIGRALVGVSARCYSDPTGGSAVRGGCGGRLRSRRSSGKGSVTPTELARTAAILALEKKATDVLVLDLRRFSVGCDYFVIASGTSDPHVRAIAEWVEEQVHERHGELPWHREGLAAARWILLDYVDVVVHVFLAEARQNYLLERLWGDAPSEEFGPGEGDGAPEEVGGEDEETPGAESER